MTSVTKNVEINSIKKIYLLSKNGFNSDNMDYGPESSGIEWQKEIKTDKPSI